MICPRCKREVVPWPLKRADVCNEKRAWVCIRQFEDVAADIARREGQGSDAVRIYGLAEIAKELGENVNTVRAWMYRGKLPAPTETLKGGHVWQGEEIESWIIDRKGETR